MSRKPNAPHDGAIDPGGDPDKARNRNDSEAPADDQGRGRQHRRATPARTFFASTSGGITWRPARPVGRRHAVPVASKLGRARAGGKKWSDREHRGHKTQAAARPGNPGMPDQPTRRPGGRSRMARETITRAAVGAARRSGSGMRGDSGQRPLVGASNRRGRRGRARTTTRAGFGRVSQAAPTRYGHGYHPARHCRRPW